MSDTYTVDTEPVCAEETCTNPATGERPAERTDGGNTPIVELVCGEHTRN